MHFGSKMKSHMVQMIDLHLSHIKHTKCQYEGVAIGRIQTGVPAQTKTFKQK